MSNGVVPASLGRPRIVTAPVAAVRAAARVWRLEPAVRAGTLAAVLGFVGLQCLMAAWVHYAFEGRYHGAFLVKGRFGTPAVEAAHGLLPVVSPYHSHDGWDGQFYYRISNDPLGLTDAGQCMPTVTYRYQRIGVPALAWAASAAAGHQVTSPYGYLTIQNALAAVGLGAVVFWLVRQGANPWFAATWLGAGGTLYTLFYGLPDASGDGVFAVAFCLLWYRRLVAYALAAALLILVREGYVLFPFAVFVGTVAGVIRWGDAPHCRWTAAAWAALPGVVLVGWAVYLAEHFGVSLTAKDRSPPGIYAVPFTAFWSTLVDAVDRGNAGSVFHRLAAMTTLLTVTALTARRAGRRAEFACVLPYLLLLPFLGPLVWWDQSGFFKMTGTVLIVGLFLLPGAGLWLRFVLTLNLVIGLEWEFARGLFPAPFFSVNGPPFVNEPYPVHPFHAAMNDPRNAVPPLPGHPANGPLRELRYDLEWLDESAVLRPGYSGPWRWAHRELVPLRVRVTNRGAEPYQPNPRLGWGSVNVAYVLTDPERSRVVLDGRVPLDGPVGPGEQREMTVWLRLGKPGRHQLTLAVVQDGFHGLDPLHPSHGLTRPVKIR